MSMSAYAQVSRGGAGAWVAAVGGERPDSHVHEGCGSAYALCDPGAPSAHQSHEAFNKEQLVPIEFEGASVDGLNEKDGVSIPPRLPARPGQSAPREHRGEQKKWGC